MLLLDSIYTIFESLIFLTSFISNSKSFPQPLNPEEERYHLERLKEGDLESKAILIERNLRLVAHVIKKYNNENREVEDLISIGTIGLIKAIDSYKMSKGTKLATYAAKCIENEILMVIRNNKKTKNDMYLQDTIGFDREGNEISLIDVLGNNGETVVEIVENEIEIKRLYEVMGKLLTDREKKVIEMRYGLNNKKVCTQREIASILSISRSYVSRIEKKALSKLLEAIDD